MVLENQQFVLDRSTIWKKFLFDEILLTNVQTCLPSLPMGNMKVANTNGLGPR